MKKKVITGVELTLLIISMLTFALNVQQVKSLEPPETEWTKTYGGDGYEAAYSVVQTLDGGYALAGYTDSFGAGWEDFWLVKVDSSGNPQWNKTYGGASYDYACSVVVTGDGGYAIAGYTASFGGEGSDFWLVKVDSSGNPQWNKTYGGSDEDYTYSVVQTLDGGYALAGYTASFGVGNYDFWLVKTDANGNMQWIKTYGGNNIDGAHSVVQTLDGGYALAGTTSSFGAGWEDFWLVKVDSSGNPQWNKTYGGSDHDCAYSVVQTSDGGYALAGYTMSFGAGIEDFWLVRTDSSGNPQWNKTYGGSDYDGAYSFVQTSDGGYALAGYTESFGAGITDFWLVKTDAGGNMQWTKTYGGSNEDSACSVVQTLDGGYALAGYTGFGEISSNFMLVKVGPARAPSTRYPWPMFHHNLRHTGYSESPAPTTNKTQWTYTTGSAIESSPAVVDGKVYVGSYDNKTYCLDASTGAHIWNYTTGGPVISSPAIADGKVYVGSDDGKVYCLDASSGVRIWDYTTGGPVSSSPAVADGKVYVGSNDNNVYCLYASTGEFVWNYTTGGLVRSSPAVAYGRVYVGSYDNKVYCLDASTGAHIWNYTTGGLVRSCPAVADGKVYVGSRFGDNSVYCLDAFSGVPIWIYTTGGPIWSSPAIAYGKVYVGSYDDKVYCLDASTGVHIWNYTTDGDVFSSPAVADGKVYVGSNDCNVYCLNALTGAYVWSYTTDDFVSSPAIADGMVFIGSFDYRVYAFGDVIRVPEDYPTVQEAINNATAGATISIALGTYYESVIINKPLTILGRKGTSPTFVGGGSGIAFNILSNASGTTIAGFVITNYAQAIFIDGASNCKIYDNIMTQNANSGIAEGNSAANNLIYSNVFQQNIGAAISLTQYSTSSTVYNNTIILNSIGLNIASSGNTIYWNIFIDNTRQANIEDPLHNINAWDKGYPDGGNYWSGYTGVDEKSGPGQNLAGSDGIGDTPYTIDIPNNIIDRYPLMKPFSPHDIGITNVIPSKTIVGQGFTLRIDLKILNFGIHNELFTATIYADAAIIATQTVTLTRRNCTTVTFTWNTSGFVKGNYTIKAIADTISGEIDTTDNTYRDGYIVVAMVGDVVLDGTVDVFDLVYVALSFGAEHGKPPPPGTQPYDPNADLNGDSIIDIFDIVTLALHYGETDP